MQTEDNIEVNGSRTKLIVEFSDQVDLSEVASLRDQFGFELVDGANTNFHLWSTLHDPVEASAVIATIPDVARVELNQSIDDALGYVEQIFSAQDLDTLITPDFSGSQANDPKRRNLWGLDKINAETAWIRPSAAPLLSSALLIVVLMFPTPILSGIYGSIPMRSGEITSTMTVTGILMTIMVMILSGMLGLVRAMPMQTKMVTAHM